MKRWLVPALGLLASTAYFAQHLTLPLNGTEGAVMLTYVDKVASGQRVHFDFFDYYGPLTWSLPALFYRLAGNAVIGVAVMMLLVKIASVAVVHELVRRLADRLHAALAAIVIAILLGQIWPFFQIPYAAHLCFPLVMLVWLLLFAPGVRLTPRAAIAAGLLTAAIAWIKITTGAFVLAGGLYYLFYLRPIAAGPAQAASETRGGIARSAKLAGLVAYGAVFHAFMRAHFDWRYFLYLSLPLIVVLAWTARGVHASGVRLDAFRRRAIDAGLYASAAALAWSLFLVGYFRGEAAAYLAEQISVLARLDYARPFPALGARSAFGAFNSMLWPELPWLVTALFIVWLSVRARWNGSPTAASTLPPEHAAAAGLFACFTLHTFVLYPRADESYLLSATLPAVVLLFVLLYRLEQALAPRIASARRLGIALSTLLLLALIPLVSLPSTDDYRFGAKDWGSRRLRRLRYHPTDYPIELAGRPLSKWDREADDAARQVDALTEDGEAVLVLGKSQLLNFASHTEPAGGRYAHLFYLLRNGVLAREAFLELVPRAVLESFYADPPRVMVEEQGDRTLLERLPELQFAIARSRYRLVGRWSIFRVYVRETQNR